jgi:hypothetical protein
MAKGSMRERMPETAKLIDSLRKAFGEACIDQVIKAGVSGEPVFYASENGHQVGTRPAEQQEDVSRFEAIERRLKLKGVR